MASAAGTILMQCGRCQTRMNAPLSAAQVSCPGCHSLLNVPRPAVPAATPAYGGAYGAGAYTAPRPPPKPTGPAALFAAVDTDKSGQISAVELQKALSSDGWVEFSMRTVQLMIALFDTDRSRTIGPKEFESLYNFLVAWKKCFDGIDADKSGAIDYKELQAALVQLGYRLESVTLNNIFRYYDGDNSGTMGFDEFIACMLELQQMTSVFQRYDTTRSGYITIDYNTYLQIMMAAKV